MDNKSKGLIIKGYYGTYEVIEVIEYSNNAVYLVDSEEDYHKGCFMIIDDENRVIIEDAKSKEDYIKYVDRLNSYADSFSMDRR